jgi:hypothetical protein
VVTRQEKRPVPARPEDAKTLEEYVASLAAKIPDFEAQIDALTRTRPVRNVASDAVSYAIRPYEKRQPEFHQMERLPGTAESRETATWKVLCRANSGALPPFHPPPPDPERNMSDACKGVDWQR